MTQYLTSTFKAYCASYAGLSAECWQRIGVNFINTTAGGISFFLSLYFVKILHINIATAGIIVSCYGFGTAVGGILGGKLADKFSPEIVAITSTLLQAIGFLFLLKIKTVDLLMLNLFILGVAAYGFKTTNMVWILQRCKDHEEIKLKTINILYAAVNLGLGLSAILISWLAQYGFDLIFSISSALLFLSTIFSILQAKKSRLGKADIHVSVKQEINSDKGVTTRGSKQIFCLALICLFLVGLIVAQLSSTYPIYIHDKFPQLGAKAVGILFAVNSVLIVVLQTPLVNFFNKNNKILMVGIGSFLYGLGMLMLGFSSMYVVAIIGCLIYTAGEMLFFSTAQLVAYQQGGAKKKGQAMGVYQTVFASSIVVGPTIGGFIYHHNGGNVIWYLCGFIGVICLVACICYKNYS